MSLLVHAGPCPASVEPDCHLTQLNIEVHAQEDVTLASLRIDVAVQKHGLHQFEEGIPVESGGKASRGHPSGALFFVSSWRCNKPSMVCVCWLMDLCFSQGLRSYTATREALEPG